MPRVAPPGEMKTSPACFPGPNVLPIPTATAPPNLPQPCCTAAQCNTLPPHAPSNPASNRPNPGRNPWIEVALGQIGPRGSRTASAGFQAPSTRIMSHLRHLTPSNTRTPRTVESGTQIVITRAGVLGFMWRLARSGPGGPALLLQASRLHPHASCLTCATSLHPTPAPPAPSPPA